jgi:hypothetical protein
MTVELEKIWKELYVTYAGICLKGLRKITENSLYLSRQRFEPGIPPLEFKSGSLPLDQSVWGGGGTNHLNSER